MSSIHTRRFRRALLATAMAATTAVGTLALPAAGVAAAPASVVSTTGTHARPRVADPIADQAAQALAAIQRYGETGDEGALHTFEQTRDLIAIAVAERLELDPAALQAAWRTADLEHQTALIAALSQLGVWYQRNTSRAGVSFDCSGLTTWAWGQAGFELKDGEQTTPAFIELIRGMWPSNSGRNYTDLLRMRVYAGRPEDDPKSLKLIGNSIGSAATDRVGFSSQTLSARCKLVPAK